MVAIAKQYNDKNDPVPIGRINNNLPYTRENAIKMRNAILRKIQA